MLIPPQLPPPPPPNTVVPGDLQPPPAPPPAPFTGPLVDSLRALHKRLIAPILPTHEVEETKRRATENLADGLAHSSLGLFNAVAKSPVQLVDAALALATASIACAFEMPAATMATTLHLGTPHTHTHPPAAPLPLPSFGPLMFGGAASVLINGMAAARAGDLGMSITCGTLAPPFTVATGASKVFYGPNRAARAGDMTRHCAPTKAAPAYVTEVPRIDSALNTLIAANKSRTASRDERRHHHAAAVATDTATAATLAATAEGDALNATIQAEQAARGALVLAWQALLGKDPGTPACHGMLLPTNATSVQIGGFPLPPTLRTLVGLKKPLLTATRDVGIILGLAAALAGVDYLARRANALRSDLCIYTGHPVDVVTGSLVFTALDLDLPGSPPLRLERRYSSTWSDRPSPLGRGWSHSLDEAVWLEHGQLIYRADDGRELTLPIPPTDDPLFVPLHRLTLRRLADDHWQIADTHGITRHFAPLAHHPTPARLVSRTDRQGRALHLHHDAQARLVSARADDGREILLHHDGDRLTRIDLPDPDPGSTRFLPHIHYLHEHDLLTEIHDALGQVTRYRHDHHRITEETLPGGLRFHFAYDGPASQAACVRTWGDGGILDHRLIFDRSRRTTLVINACNETTTYRADERNLVIEIVDPLGHTTRHQYDELLRLRARIDPLGHVTHLEYDERGNLTRHEAPDGALTLTTYHPTLDLPLERIDPAGGVTRWTYDPLGRLLRHTDPLGRSTVHHHDLSPEPSALPNLSPGTSITTLHPDGRSTVRHHDLAGRLVHLRDSDGSTLTHHHDRRGQLVCSTDDRGRSETRDHDLLGRLTRHLLPDGELRLHTHDPRGRPLRSSDPRGELHCSYTGLGWLTTCGSASAAPITLERDLEGRISRVAGPAGTLLRIERDPAGRVRSTVDALGHTRRYTRDPLGRVLAIRRPDGQRTRYTRDPAGRIVTVDHGDGTLDRFTYRLDGPLQTATRQHPDRSTTTTRRELDALGRITREHQDEHHLTHEYDLQGRITRLRSSLGADLRFIHDDRGLARLELPRPTHPDAPWSIHIERDRDGHEQARHLPGDLLSWWHRDPHGRPLEHGLVASRPPQIHRHRRYHWRGPALQIDEISRRRISPHLSPRPGPSWTYTFTAAGELGTATTPDGPTLQYRHDALGRRISRVRDGLTGPLTTRWLWHGDTLLHQWTHRHDVITWPHEPDRPAPLARLTATTRHAVISDHLGSPLALLDERGQLAWSAELDARGLPRPVRGDPALCPFRHPGQLADPDTGLHHNRLRELDPATGRYLSPDPLGLLGGLDLHAHLDDPGTTTDILGLTPDLPHGVHARIAAELVADFPLHDLPPHLAELAHQPGRPSDRRTGVAAIYATPPRGPCD